MDGYSLILDYKFIHYNFTGLHTKSWELKLAKDIYVLNKITKLHLL